MDREKQALKRLLAYVLNEFESIGVEVNHHSVSGDGVPLVEWSNATNRYEVRDA